MPVTIANLHREFDPNLPLSANSPVYVDLLAARGVEAILASALLPLRPDENYCAQFFTGHLGDGKTTLLRRLEVLLKAERVLVAFGEADDLIDLQNLEYEDLLIAMLTTVQQAAGAEVGRDRVQEYF